MKEYIERAVALEALSKSGVTCNMRAHKIVASIQAADVAPVVHGKWEHTHTSESYFNECWRCSACGFDDTEGFGFKFCPNCGAKMDQLG